MLRFITKKITPAKNGAATKKINDIFRSRSIAITMAPAARNGARITKRISMATACCIWFTSLVKRVIRDGVPNLSTSA